MNSKPKKLSAAQIKTLKQAARRPTINTLSISGKTAEILLIGGYIERPNKLNAYVYRITIKGCEAIGVDAFDTLLALAERDLNDYALRSPGMYANGYTIEDRAHYMAGLIEREARVAYIEMTYKFSRYFRGQNS